MSSTISSVSSTPTTTSTATTTTSIPSASSIISSAGIGLGSTFPISQVLTGLMEVESIPLTQLQNQVTGVQTEISAYGQLSSALSTFQSTAQQLTLPTDYEVYSADSSDTDVVTAAAVAGSETGTYDVDVTQLAQPQTVIAAAQASESTDLATDTGSATVTFTFGTTTGSGSSASFTPNDGQTSGSITINSSNDTLSGIANAINSAGLGVTAQIVTTGNASAPYTLEISGSTTGADESFQVSVSGDSNIASILTYPASGSTGGLTETAAAQNAKLTVNGLSVTSSTNTNTSLPGIVLQLNQTGSSTVTVSQNISAIETNINNFVSAYNTLQSTIASLTAYNPGGTNGALIGDATTQQIQTQLQQIIASSIAGTGGGLSTLASVGVALSSDGTLSVNDTTLVQQLQSNGSEFAGLFGTAGFATNSSVSYVTGSSSTQAGSYDVVISQAATQGTAVGSTGLASSTVLSSDTALTVTVNGVAANITIPAGTYTQSQLATEIQNEVNTNSAIETAGYSVDAAVNSTTGILSVTSTTWGSSSSVSITGDGAAQLFGTATSTAGENVEGSIGGQAATGSGQTLTASSGAANGLEVEVTGTATGNLGTVNYSLGYAAQLNNIISAATASSTGSIATATAQLNTQISGIETQETNLQQYIDQVQAQYQTEFTALDASLSQLNSTSTFLQETFDPTTSSS
jgi:flagellar hook-associated protein 2